MNIAVLILSMVCLMSTPVRAEWYLAADLLQARYRGPTIDGNWQQQLLPSRDGLPAVAQTKESLAWDVGAGYRFADGDAWYRTRLSVEIGYRTYGEGISAGGLGVNDEQYGQIVTGEVSPHTYTSSEYEAADHLQGGYVRLAKGFDVGYGLAPYVSGGVEVLYHDLNMWGRNPRHTKAWSVGYAGLMVGPTVGGGVTYALGRGLAARVGVESHWMITESGHPITNHWVTVGGGIEVPWSVFTEAAGSTRDYLWQR